MSDWKCPNCGKACYPGEGYPEYFHLKKSACCDVRIVRVSDAEKLRAELAESEKQKEEAVKCSHVIDDYRTTIEEALDINFLGVSTGNAKADLSQLIAWEVKVALDPAVSSDARDLQVKSMEKCEKLGDNLQLICTDSGHDDRWCAHCSAMEQGIEQYQNAIRAYIVELSGGK
jgi:hypothetical protein